MRRIQSGVSAVTNEPRVPLGKALHWTDNDLARLSEITPEDVARARARFGQDVGPEFAGLLDAVPDEPTSKRRRRR